MKTTLLHKFECGINTIQNISENITEKDYKFFMRKINFDRKKILECVDLIDIRRTSKYTKEEILCRVNSVISYYEQFGMININEIYMNYCLEKESLDKRHEIVSLFAFKCWFKYYSLELNAIMNYLDNIYEYNKFLSVE